jgi:hypothetical protein
MAGRIAPKNHREVEGPMGRQLRGFPHFTEGSQAKKGRENGLFNPFNLLNTLMTCFN